MGKYLFVYGTLAPGREPEPLRPYIARLTQVGPASVAGSLYDLGPYPGAILEGPGTVFGQVFGVPDDAALWAALDAYEGFDPQEPDAGLFCRKRCIATFDDGGEAECQIYTYNGKPSDDRLIRQGRWNRVVTGHNMGYSAPARD